MGYVITFISAFFTLSLYVLSKPIPGSILLNPWLSISQILALIGITLFSFTYVLSSRWYYLEDWFGGLDKVYKLHHLIGSIAFVMLIHHPLLLALNALPDLSTASGFIFLSSSLAYNFGVLSLYSMILLLVFTFLIKLPYDLWLKTHDFMGLSLAFAVIHVLTINSDISRYLPLKLWILSWLFIAVIFYVSKVFFYKYLGPHYRYQVSSVKIIGDLIEIYLSPISKVLKFSPGQYAFIGFDQSGLKEPHPFSFSSTPNDKQIRFSVKMSGDYTPKLKGLMLGTTASVWGAYGRLNQNFFSHRDVVCITGGIGVTPFVSLISAELKQPKNRQIYFFYTAKSESQATYHQTFLQYTKDLSNFHYFPYFTNTKPRLSAVYIAKNLSHLNDKIFYLCGPTSMMLGLTEQLLNLKIKRSNIIFEDFSFK